MHVLTEGPKRDEEVEQKATERKHLFFPFRSSQKQSLLAGAQKMHNQSRDRIILHFAKVTLFQKFFCSSLKVLIFLQLVELVGQSLSSFLSCWRPVFYPMKTSKWCQHNALSFFIFLFIFFLLVFVFFLFFFSFFLYSFLFSLVWPTKPAKLTSSNSSIGHTYSSIKHFLCFNVCFLEIGLSCVDKSHWIWGMNFSLCVMSVLDTTTTD